MIRTSQQMYGVRRTMAQGTRSTSSRGPIVTRTMTAPDRTQGVEQILSSSPNTPAPTQETFLASIPANARASSVIPAPAPGPLAPVTMLPMISAPRVTSAEIQKTIDDIADRMNLLVAHENAHYAQQIQFRRQSQQYRRTQPQPVQPQQQNSEASSSSNPNSPLPDGRGEIDDAADGEMTPRAVERDKENQSYGSWLQIHRPSSQATTPLRDTVNITYQRQPLSEANRESEKERDKEKGKRSRKLRRAFDSRSSPTDVVMLTLELQLPHWTCGTRAIVKALHRLSSPPRSVQPAVSSKAGSPTFSTGKASHTPYTHTRTLLPRGRKQPWPSHMRA
jgi:hypothetical protein